MTLEDYLKTSTQTELAERLGVSQGLISQWLSGDVKISPERAIAIEEATRGIVTREEILPKFFRRVA
ncbi:transcriptional regulator [Methylomonas koyamae]|uniref:transcriptional regulator n=1 Tax=Methylomonas koyamae TaxID=702114 RepID=UPI0011273A78|nr:YdaS family helix-turn-helix protein [Methylomonas koyamae]TPQ24920.1 Cro/Cl family transcriptional regulator [Methylomonas koyamae]